MSYDQGIPPEEVATIDHPVSLFAPFTNSGNLLIVHRTAEN